MNVPDLDLMTLEEIQRWTDSAHGLTMAQFALALFPDKPKKFRIATKILFYMANLKLLGKSYRRRDAKFEREYLKLPRFAQWRRYGINIRACVIPGKTFRRWEPKKYKSRHKEKKHR
jgi:hypothetical protein